MSEENRNNSYNLRTKIQKENIDADKVVYKFIHLIIFIKFVHLVMNIILLYIYYQLNYKNMNITQSPNNTHTHTHTYTQTHTHTHTQKSTNSVDTVSGI